MSTLTELRLRLFASGIEVLPSTTSKEVFWKGWRERPIDEATIRSWETHADWPNTSGRAARTPCLDLDIRDPDAVEACEQLVRGYFDGRGEILVRIGMPPKRLIPFRTAAPFQKRTLIYQAGNGEKQRIEFLGDGQQAVLFGYHAEAKRHYSCAGRDPLTVPPAEWPEISELEADALLDMLDEMLTEQCGFERAADDERKARGNGAAHATYRVTDAAAALADLRYQGKGGGGNIHDIELGCINRLLVDGTNTEAAIEEVFSALRAYGATNPLCARWDWARERRRLEGMAFSFINKYPDYADRLPPELYAIRQIRRGQGVSEPTLESDRAHRCWHYRRAARNYALSEATLRQATAMGTKTPMGRGRRGSRNGSSSGNRSFASFPSAYCVPAMTPATWSTN